MRDARGEQNEQPHLSDQPPPSGRFVSVLTAMVVTCAVFPLVANAWGVACWVLDGTFHRDGSSSWAEWYAYPFLGWALLGGIVVGWAKGLGWAIGAYGGHARRKSFLTALGILVGALLGAFVVGLVRIATPSWKPIVERVHPGQFWIAGSVLGVVGGFFGFTLGERHEDH